MSLFSKPKVVIWPKNNSVEIYFGRKDNNFFSLDLNLWEEKTDKDLEGLVYLFNQNKITQASVLIPDDVVATKSFVYDTKIETIDKKEVISLASGFVNFDIDPESIEYSLIQDGEKTIINAVIYDKSKFDHLKSNLLKTNFVIDAYKPVSAAVSDVVSKIYLSEFFLIYPLNEKDYTLLLSKNNQVYLTANFKGPSLDIQKTINYAQLYFSNPVTKIYYPENKDLDIVTSTEMEKTSYNESQIAQNSNQPGNIPLPVVSQINGIIKSSQDINLSKQPNMNNKKNLVPIIAVIIFSFAIVSFIVYFIMSKNKSSEIIDGSQTDSDAVPTTVIETVTPEPTPTIAEISKDIKIQVLNATDINGQAATLKAKLVSLGFENVAVGNAAVSATTNSVQVKSATTSAYFESVLSQDFPATYTEDLKSTSAYDAVFTIGTDISGMKTTTTTTVTPTKVATPTSTKVTPTVVE
ncbi:MAG TPA: LytR C-terminal domain-containing protein [Candidatus Woesebacteria bacterium]|nr:LytR C-terminal domain-containing protein [Candidatus Woesebacteria bacterium]HOG37520.1 LytR C-terminal domain-containing protein [Candidatus Woesebacteria bacterium]